MQNPAPPTARRFAVAPMMDWTDRHCRRFHRLLTGRALLYTEMVTTGAILQGDRERFLGFDLEERPLALQVGGSDPDDLARVAELAAARGFDEINLNCGCPSDRVQQGRFGACLMAEPALVRDCLAAMRRAGGIAVTVKCRIGIDGRGEYEDLLRFVETVAESGVETFIVHARMAWLQGLSPKQNRELPPLRYALVERLKRERPALTVVLNGGLDLTGAEAALSWADGVMLGRAAYQEPYLLAQVDHRFFDASAAVPTRTEIVESLIALAERQVTAGRPLKYLARHTLGLMNGLPGARAWRRILAEGMTDPAASPDLFRRAAAAVRLDAALAAAA